MAVRRKALKGKGWWWINVKRKTHESKGEVSGTKSSKLLHTEVDPFWSKNIDWHDPDMPLPSKDPEPPGCWPFHVPLDQRPWSGRCSQPCESESMRGRGVHQISLSTLDETQIDTVARVYSSANHVVACCSCQGSSHFVLTCPRTQNLENIIENVKCVEFRLVPSSSEGLQFHFIHRCHGSLNTTFPANSSHAYQPHQGHAWS